MTFEESFIVAVKRLRQEIKDLCPAVYDLRHPESQDHPERLSEMSSNIILAYRHLEDAAMRLGKAIQAADGGVSVYDK